MAGVVNKDARLIAADSSPQQIDGHRRRL